MTPTRAHRPRRSRCGTVRSSLRAVPRRLRRVQGGRQRGGPQPGPAPAAAPGPGTARRPARRQHARRPGAARRGRRVVPAARRRPDAALAAARSTARAAVPMSAEPSSPRPTTRSVPGCCRAHRRVPSVDKPGVAGPLSVLPVVQRVRPGGGRRGTARSGEPVWRSGGCCAATPSTLVGTTRCRSRAVAARADVTGA